MWGTWILPAIALSIQTGLPLHVALLSRKFDEHSLIELALLKVARESSQRNSEDCLGNVEKWRVLFSPEVNAFVVLESEQLFGIL